MDAGYLLETFLENTPDHVYFKDTEGRFTRISASLVRWLGVDDMAQALGRSDADFFAASHAELARAAELEVMRTGEPIVGLEERELWQDGHVSWVSTTKVPLRARSGEVIGIFGLARDITARKLAEEHTRQQAAELERLAAQLEQLTLHDQLTGLYNLRGLELLGGGARGPCRTRGLGALRAVHRPRRAEGDQRRLRPRGGRRRARRGGERPARRAPPAPTWSPGSAATSSPRCSWGRRPTRRTSSATACARATQHAPSGRALAVGQHRRRGGPARRGRHARRAHRRRRRRHVRRAPPPPPASSARLNPRQSDHLRGGHRVRKEQAMSKSQPTLVTASRWCGSSTPSAAECSR